MFFRTSCNIPFGKTIFGIQRKNVYKDIPDPDIEGIGKVVKQLYSLFESKYNLKIPQNPISQNENENNNDNNFIQKIRKNIVFACPEKANFDEKKSIFAYSKELKEYGNFLDSVKNNVITLRDAKDHKYLN